MKAIIITMLMVALTTVYGCQWNSPKGGSMAKGKGFTISTPNYVTEIKQGEVKSVTVSLERGKYFKQNVRLQLDTPAGIQIEPGKITVGANDKPDIQVKFTASKDSPLGEYRISVIGTPETGEPTSTVFNIKVVTP